MYSFLNEENSPGPVFTKLYEMRNESIFIVCQYKCKSHSFIGTLSSTLFQEHVLSSYIFSLPKRLSSLRVLQEWDKFFLHSPPGYLTFWTDNAHESVELSVCTMTKGLPDPIPVSNAFMNITSCKKIVSCCHYQSWFWVAPVSIPLVL